MGIERDDFIDNPNRTEYVDEEDLDFDDHVFPIDINYLDDDDLIDDDFEDDTPNGRFIFSNVPDIDEDIFDDDDDDGSTIFDPDDMSDNYLSDSDDDSDDGELRGLMVNGIFVQSGGNYSASSASEVWTSADDTNSSTEIAEDATAAEKHNGNNEVVAKIVADSDGGELRGLMINGIFVQSGGNYSASSASEVWRCANDTNSSTAIAEDATAAEKHNGNNEVVAKIVAGDSGSGDGVDKGQV